MASWTSVDVKNVEIYELWIIPTGENIVESERFTVAPDNSTLLSWTMNGRELPFKASNEWMKSHCDCYFTLHESGTYWQFTFMGCPPGYC